MKVNFHHGNGIVKAKDFTFCLRLVPSSQNSAEQFSIFCRKNGEDRKLSTDWSHRFHTAEEAARFCEKILHGELDFLTLCDEEETCKERGEETERVMLELKRETRINKLLEDARSAGIAPAALYDTLWAFSDMDCFTVYEVLDRLVKNNGLLPHVHLTLPECCYCGHYIDETRVCHGCDGVLDMSKTYGPEYHAPRERVKDIGCKRFSLRKGNYIYQQRLTVWFCHGAESVELGDVLVPKTLDVQDATNQTAIKRQVILDKLFDNAALDAMAKENIHAAIDSIKLDIWYWCNEESRERRVMHT